jgi:hypothetical protein
VKVPSKDRDCLRFYWWKNGNTEKEPLVYRMTVHLFGATSSTSCCNFALHQTAEKDKDDFSPKVAETVMKNMYVDDCLTSVSTKEDAKSLIRDISTLCQMGGFRLTKFLSNSVEVMQSIPEEDRATDIEKWNLSSDIVTERALGIYWFVVEDKLGFRVNIKNQPSTRRGILSVISGVYDPLGIVSPFVLTAKFILQTLCRKGIGWDAEIPKEEQARWQKWLCQVQELRYVTVDRCYMPPNFKNVISCQLHCFADG